MSPETTMFDYRAWLQRARSFVEGVRSLPGDIRIEINIEPPISHEELAPLIAKCRLPVPPELIRFFTEASRHCLCSYWWRPPEEYRNQLRLIAPNWGGDYFWGGLELVGADALRDDFDIESFEDYPKDRRFWEHSLPFLEVGNGDIIGLYLRDRKENPPVAYLVHDGGGGSEVFSPSFEEFLTQWERIGFLGANFFFSFVTNQGILVPSKFPVQLEALKALFRGEPRPDLVSPSEVMTESAWLSETDFYRLCEYIKQIQGPLCRRKQTLFAAACCRRKWELFGDLSRYAVDVAELFADGKADAADRESVRAYLCSDDDPGSSPTGEVAKAAEALFLAVRERQVKRVPARRMSSAAIWTIDGIVIAPWFITQHLDDPEQTIERHAYADLFRHIWGNPFCPLSQLNVIDRELLVLAKRLYDGEAVASDLRKCLVDHGLPELANHFESPDHPKGCYALDAILQYSLKEP